MRGCSSRSGSSTRPRRPTSRSNSRPASPLKKVINMCANNYLGLSSHPEVVKAAHEGLDVARLRHVVGPLHLRHPGHPPRARAPLTEFLGTEDTLLFPSCMDANAGVFEAILTKDDVMISDRLVHASLVDGIRLCSAMHDTYQALRHGPPRGEAPAPRRQAPQARHHRRRLLHGRRHGQARRDGRRCARSTTPCSSSTTRTPPASSARPAAARTRSAASSARSTSSRRPSARPSAGRPAAASPAAASSSRCAASGPGRTCSPTPSPRSSWPASSRSWTSSPRSTERRDKLERNAAYWRKGLTEAGFVLKEGDTPIVPVMLFNAKLAQDFSRALYDEGIYAIGFFFPVVAQGQARIRTQISAGHETHHLDKALAAFTKVGKKFDILGKTKQDIIAKYGM